LETGFEAFVNTGSSSEYGLKDHAPAETEGLEPNSYYAVAKASATMFCRYTAQHHRVHLVTLRLYSVYGPYEEPTRLIPTLIINGVEKRWPPLVSPDIARDYTYIEDVNRAYLLAATVPPHEWGAIYNVGTGVQTTLRQVADVARHSLQIPAEPAWGTMANRSWDTTTWVANNQAIQQHVGWRPAYDFAQGLQRTIEWFQSHPAMRAWYQEQQQRVK
jgi:dolichol-phosphate mannosyltransferase